MRAIGNRNEIAASSVTVTGRRIWLLLKSGRKIELPTAKFPRLANAPTLDLKRVELRRGGAALRWANLDEDIKVETVVNGTWPTHGGRRAGSGRRPLNRTALTAYLSKDLVSKLASVAAARNASRSDVINAAVADYVARI
jgi:hypothetical protein